MIPHSTGPFRELFFWIPSSNRPSDTLHTLCLDRMIKDILVDSICIFDNDLKFHISVVPQWRVGEKCPERTLETSFKLQTFYNWCHQPTFPPPSQIMQISEMFGNQKLAFRIFLQFSKGRWRFDRCHPGWKANGSSQGQSGILSRHLDFIVSSPTPPFVTAQRLCKYDTICWIMKKDKDLGE